MEKEKHARRQHKNKVFVNLADHPPTANAFDIIIMQIYLQQHAPLIRLIRQETEEKTIHSFDFLLPMCMPSSIKAELNAKYL